MKKNNELEDEHELEIIKAVAQAWHGHSSSFKSTTEFDAHRRNFKSKPTRFKLEAMRMASAKDDDCSTSWDFGQSLWDSYEIVSVAKKLESGLVLEHRFSAMDRPSSSGKKRKESKNSLRNLFNRISYRRFNEDDLPWEKGSRF